MSLIYSRFRFFAAVAITVVFVSAVPAVAQWRDCGAIVCSAESSQGNPQAVPCDNGGAVIAWSDDRGDDIDIYIQRIDALGNPLWTSDGVLVCGGDDDQSIIEMVQDGEGGVIIMWVNSQDNHIYAQRVDSSGNPLWTTNGVVVTGGGIYGYMGASMAPDGAGGAFFAWCDTQYDSFGDIYAQHLDSLGVPHSYGLPVSAIPDEEQAFPILVSDGGGGAIVVWRGVGGSYRLYAQRLDWYCLPLWAWPEGVSVTSEGSQWFYDAVTDDAGGVIVAYIYSYCTNGVHAQRLDGSGNLVWPEGGVQIHTGTINWRVELVKDGKGGAIVVWDNDVEFFTDLEAQAVDASGGLRWPAEGVMLCDAEYEQVNLSIATDDAGGAFLAWQDARSGTLYDVFAQHVDSSGTCMWNDNGTAVCSADDYGQINPCIVRDDQGGAIVVWGDYRDPADINIYANRIRIGTNAGEGDRPPSNHLAQNYPNPFNPVTTISFELAETGPAVSLRVYDVSGRLIRTLIDGSRTAGPHTVQWDGKDNHHQTVASGVYLYRLTSGSFSRTKKMVFLK